MEVVVLSNAQARKIILHATGLSRKGFFGKGKEAVYKTIAHLGFVQIDTNYTVERAHHHTLFARVPDYKPVWLEELQAEGRLYEFFTSDAGYLPMEQFRFSLPVKAGFAAARKELPPAEVRLMDQVMDRIGREGPLMVKDFENDRREASAGWWDWRPSKVALERLYLDGHLMVTRTKEFQKLYDLPRNILPEGTNTEMPDPQAFARHVILRELQALGIAYAKEVAWRARYVKGHLIKKELEQMVEEGLLLRVAIEGQQTAPLYMLPFYKNRKITLSGEAFILSPFDGLNVFRHRLRDFFDFDYQIECFVPAPKRQYGYFSLPVLLGDTFIARMDAKADRKQHALLIHNLHFEAVTLNAAALAQVAAAIKAFARFNQCDTIVLTKSNKRTYQQALKKLLV